MRLKTTGVLKDVAAREKMVTVVTPRGMQNSLVVLLTS